ncbi:serine hydrolase [Streptomyces qinglanensis]|uniref:Beta-lactamase enzyme family protein n=1 Tax=Streptomyces qinglanensis TaxID=943816 RepID=A0A1H9SW61_9ACTN|nr:serine hydrolase [Streptomyces qinglanensis]SER88623.1 Beta-lactamase enzyme family protein [Streptomyces qinglanensis]
MNARGGTAGGAPEGGRPQPDRARAAGQRDAVRLPEPAPPARLSVAAQPLEGAPGAVARGADEVFVAASVMKVHILAALALRAQGALGHPAREVTAQERAWAAAMIERSDNTAANALWQAAGGAAGVTAAGRLLGTARTRAAPDGRWGLSTTTAADQLALLRAVHGRGPRREVLAPWARQWVRHLMGRVVPAQRWGVTAAADPGDDVPGVPQGEVKNGWLPRTATGLWVISSVGRVTAAGRPWLLAVLSDGHTTRQEGVAAVERAARAAVRGLTDRADRDREPAARSGGAAGPESGE